MAARVRGIFQANANLRALVNGIQDKRAARAMYMALNIGASQAALYTPIDSSTLINSQFREITVRGTRLTGRVGYSAKYAMYVHNASGKLKGQPRADFGVTRDGVSFGGGTKTGKYWDPSAKPRFLKAGFDESRQQIEEAIEREMRI
ncbi:HK97 gp10 family phage protein [Proteus vulgaris]|uniref:HK97 gp10 family phage protein n=1 Tax=Proteus vulgaris TaxID=585 RepID=UPI0018E4D9F7|nr:HK97 gp10 family phage protein [Proteus vulgaris]MBI6529076.1 HK97 gp10 family phage protein [Proteus vulgaris]